MAKKALYRRFSKTWSVSATSTFGYSSHPFGAGLERPPFGGQWVDVLDGPEVAAIGCGGRGP